MQNSQDDLQYIQVDQQTQKAIEQAKKSGITDKKNSKNQNPLIQDDIQVIKPSKSEPARYAQKQQQNLTKEKTGFKTREARKDKGFQNNDSKNKGTEKHNKLQKEHPQQKSSQNGQRTDNLKRRKEVQQIDSSQNRRYKARYFKQNYDVKIVFPEIKFRENQIFVDSEGHFNDFMAKVKKLIMKHDKIAVIANGTNIFKAITIAEQANKIYQNTLRRINIPGTLQIQKRYTPKNIKQQSFSKYQMMPTITIELSLKYLDKRHMGYQDNIVQVNYDRKSRNKSINKTEKQKDGKNYQEKSKEKHYIQKKKQNQRVHQGQYR